MKYLPEHSVHTRPEPAFLTHLPGSWNSSWPGFILIQSINPYKSSHFRSSLTIPWTARILLSWPLFTLFPATWKTSPYFGTYLNTTTHPSWPTSITVSSTHLSVFSNLYIFYFHCIILHIILLIVSCALFCLLNQKNRQQCKAEAKTHSHFANPTAPGITVGQGEQWLCTSPV